MDRPDPDLEGWASASRDGIASRGTLDDYLDPDDDGDGISTIDQTRTRTAIRATTTATATGGPTTSTRRASVQPGGFSGAALCAASPGSRPSGAAMLVLEIAQRPRTR
ncbi:hypothetical protein [Sandaracinus amylolyticus]|uniref:Uncharacterized protein n=1 Tax=Sandaracinus amylolyticus TaxID=927083 RepID=A0A0F6YLX8_9BACT|nr:hypothetical protein [Sandaracinus amylolyticus]AKF09728.1 hypothetical protein DB32_006877 [Sandaracinus amylolyticus]